MQEVLDCDGSCKQQLHDCIEKASDICMPICGVQVRDRKNLTGINATVGEWFDCYTDCTINTAIKCFIKSSECLYDCKLPKKPDEPQPVPEPLPEPLPEPMSRRNAQFPDPNSMRRQFFQDAQQDQRFNRPSSNNALCCSLSPCYNPCLYGLSGSPNGNFNRMNEDYSDDDDGMSLWFGFPGYGFGGFPGFGFGGYPGFGGFPGFGFGGFPGYGFGGFPGFGFGGFRPGFGIW
eukprot:MONOS_10423.1-p1 / transcript=MONOS_10423.1 / gene=MONOS_10423 / organism=Monocercomonoides_exilis_PA203 / gene_product=unspecified product / transcript_product=unspecified product / location=Mono_scaffold00474:9866-10564(+) / protein_length=233 / sequence_SO=supercontig / SO=protein_coding / is_pseudo=false